MAGPEGTESVTLGWDPSPDPTAAGYYVHYGTASRSYDRHIDVGNIVKAKISGLVIGQTYFFALTAYNQQHVESEFSGEIAYTVPTPVHRLLRILPATRAGTLPCLQFQVPPTYQYELLASDDLKSWTRVHRGVSLTTNWIEWIDPQAAYLSKRYYRLAIPDKPHVPGVLRILRGRVPHGGFYLEPHVKQGQRYQIQGSQDMKTWTTLHEGICVGTAPMYFVDSQAASLPKRFYRLALPDNPPTSSVLEIHRVGAIEMRTRLSVAALEGQHYRVQASQDMESWTTIYEGISTSIEPVELVDPQAALFPKRFYRLAFD